jgi:serine/threonine protein kinase
MLKLDNPFILKLHEAFELNDHFFLVYEYADEGSLGELIEKSKDKEFTVD